MCDFVGQSTWPGNRRQSKYVSFWASNKIGKGQWCVQCNVFTLNHKPGLRSVVLCGFTIYDVVFAWAVI